MSLSVGIVGLPNVGKSTLFNALLKKQQALVANYPFATIEPNVGIVPVPDTRLQKLAETVAQSRMHVEPMPTGKEGLTYTNLPPLVPATVTFTDIAGLVKGAAEGEGLGNKFLSHIRETKIIALVVRAFGSADVVLTGTGKPEIDMQTIFTELILADLETLGKQVEPKGNTTHVQRMRWEGIQKLEAGLNESKRATEVSLTDEELEAVTELQLITMKPVIYVINVDEAELSAMSEEALAQQYAQLMKVSESEVVIVSAKIEAELANLRPIEQTEYLATLGMTQSGLERLIKKAYATLGLISFLTAGEKEVRAWTIKSGQTALQASGVIHTDFMQHFIKADVIGWTEFIEVGGWKKGRELGRVRSEGRDYVVKDGDVVEFRIGT